MFSEITFCHLKTLPSKVLYYTFREKSRRSLVYHPQLVAVYHQCEALHLIKPQARCTLTRDDIQPEGLMIYTTAS